MKFLCANSDSSMSLFLYFSGMSGKLLFSAFIALRQIWRLRFSSGIFESCQERHP